MRTCVYTSPHRHSDFNFFITARYTSKCSRCTRYFSSTIYNIHRKGQFCLWWARRVYSYHNKGDRIFRQNSHVARQIVHWIRQSTQRPLSIWTIYSKNSTFGILSGFFIIYICVFLEILEWVCFTISLLCYSLYSKNSRTQSTALEDLVTKDKILG